MYDINNQPHISPNIVKVLWRQQQELLKKSPEYVTPIINNDDPLDIQIDLEGPKATPYEHGIFRVKLFIPNDFPISPPKGIFMTKIFHPNISEKGEICVNTLKRDWNGRNWSLYNLFEIIKCLLIIPFPQSALNEEAGKLFMEDYDKYFQVAQMYTNIYAIKNNSNINNINKINEDKLQKKNDIITNDDIEMDDECNISCKTEQIKKVPNYLFERIDNLEYKRITEAPKSNYTLDNICNENTKNNNYFRLNSINNNLQINHNINLNENLDLDLIKNKFSSSKDKPILSSLPLMTSNKINNNNFGFHRSFTYNFSSQQNFQNNTINNNPDINKWLMRI